MKNAKNEEKKPAIEIQKDMPPEVKKIIEMFITLPTDKLAKKIRMY